jgi:hypothetical protein
MVSFIMTCHYPLQLNPYRKSVLSLMNSFCGAVEEGDGRFRLRFAAVTVTCSSAIYLDVIFTGLLIIGQICTLLFTFLLAMFVDDLGVAFSGWRISSYP